MTQAPLLALEDLSIGYGSTELIAKVNAQFNAGELVCILGPNGSGKSSLLRTMTQQQSALAGQCMLNGGAIEQMDIARLAQSLAVVLTDMPRIEYMTVEGLVALGRHPYTGWQGGLGKNDQDIIVQAMAAMQIDHVAKRDIVALSDGELQRAYMARALAQDPSVLVLDEPTAFLDVMHSAHCFDLLRQWAHDNMRLVVMVTHDLSSALSMADRMGVIHDKALKIDTPDALVKSGVIEQVFSSDRLRFNVNTGRVESLALAEPR